MFHKITSKIFSCTQHDIRLIPIFFVIFFLSTSSSTFAATLYLQAKQYLDVTNGKMIQPANALIENGSITAMNPSHECIIHWKIFKL